MTALTALTLRADTSAHIRVEEASTGIRACDILAAGNADVPVQVASRWITAVNTYARVQREIDEFLDSGQLPLF